MISSRTSRRVSTGSAPEHRGHRPVPGRMRVRYAFSVPVRPQKSFRTVSLFVSPGRSA